MIARNTLTALFLLLASLSLAACAAAAPPTPPAVAPSPVWTNTPFIPPTGTAAPTNTSAPGGTPPASTPTAAVTASPDWSGMWDIYISTPTISIVNTIRFRVPFGENREMQATWIEGTRQVSMSGQLSQDRRTFSGTFFNSDAERLEFAITLLPDGSAFSGAADSPEGQGAMCGARPGQPRPNPCRSSP